MAKVTKTSIAKTNIGGNLLNEIKDKGLVPLSPENALQEQGIQAIQTTAPNILGERFVSIEDNYAKYIGRTPQIFSQADESTLMERRAELQPWYESTARGVKKFVGKTVVHGVGGFSSLGAMLSYIPVLGYKALDGKINSLKDAGKLFNDVVFDNELMRSFDKANEFIDQQNQVYKTKKQQKADFFSATNLLSVDFWAGEVVGDMLPFLAGAAIPGVGVGMGVSKFGMLAKSLKQAKKLNKALDAKDLLKIVSKGTRADALTTTLGQVLLSGYESGLQARQYRDMAIEEYTKNYLQENARNPSEEELNKFSEEITSSANGVFATNMALVSMENVVMLNKIYGKPLQKLIGVKPKASIKTPSKFNAALGTTGRFIGKPIFEGAQEFSQSWINEAATKYVMSKYSPEGHNENMTLVEAIGSSFEEMYKSDESWREAYMGMLMGLIGLPGVSTGSITEIANYFKAPQASAFAERYHKFDTGNVMKNTAINLSRIYEIARDKEAAIANGDFFETKNKESEELLSWMNSRENVGLLDEELDNYIDTLMKMSDDEFRDTYENNGLDSNEIKDRKEYIVNSLMKSKKNFYQAKELANKIVDPSTETMEGKNKDLNEYITHLAFMNQNAIDRIESIEQKIEQETGLSISDENPENNILSYFTKEGNVVSSAPKKLKNYVNRVNNYADLSTMIKDHALLTKMRDNYADAIKKLYNVDNQVSLIDQLSQKKYDIFRKFSNAVYSNKEYNRAYEYLANLKNDLTDQLDQETDPDVIQDITDDLALVDKRLNTLDRKIKSRFVPNTNLGLFASAFNEVNKIIFKTDEDIEEYQKKVKVDTGFKTSVKKMPLGFIPVSKQKSYKKSDKGKPGVPNFDFFDDPSIPDEAVFTVVKEDDKGNPTLVKLSFFQLSISTNVINYFKAEKDASGKTILIQNEYDELIDLFKQLGIGDLNLLIEKENFNSFVGILVNYKKLGELSVAYTTKDDKKRRIILSETIFNASSENDFIERIKISFGELDSLSNNTKTNALLDSVNSIADLDNDSGIDNFSDYNLQPLLNGNTYYTYEADGRIKIDVKATPKDPSSGLSEKEFSIYINTPAYKGKPIDEVNLLEEADIETLYEDESFISEQFISDIDGISKKVKDRKKVKLARANQDSLIKRMNDSYAEITRLLSIANKTPEQIKELSDLIVLYSRTIYAIKYNQDIGATIKKGEKNIFEDGKKLLLDILKQFNPSLNIDSISYNPDISDISDNALRSELKETDILPDELVDEIATLNKEGEVVRRVILPAVYDASGNLVYEAVVEVMSVSDEMLKDVKNNKKKYKRKINDLIDEEFKEEEEEEGGGEEEGGEEKGDEETFDDELLSENPVNPETTDFLRELLLLKKDSKKKFMTISYLVDRMNIDDIKKLGFNSKEELINAIEESTNNILAENPGDEVGELYFMFIPLSFKEGKYRKRFVKLSDNTKKSLFVVLKRPDGKIVPISEVEYYDAFYNGKTKNPLGKNPPSILPEYQKAYGEFYDKLKNLWNTPVEPMQLFSDKEVSFQLSVKRVNSETSIKSIVEEYPDSHFVYGDTVYSYNEKTKEFEEGDQSLIGLFRLASRNRGLNNSVLLFVKIGDKYEPITISGIIENQSSVKAGSKRVEDVLSIEEIVSRDINELLGLETLEAIERKFFDKDDKDPFIKRSNPSDISFGLKFRNDKFRFPIYINSEEDFGYGIDNNGLNVNNFEIKKSKKDKESGNIYIQHDIGLNLRLTIGKRDGKLIVNHYKREGEKYKLVGSYSVDGSFDANSYLSLIKNIVRKDHENGENLDISIGASLRFNIRSGANIKSLFTVSEPVPALKMNISGVSIEPETEIDPEEIVVFAEPVDVSIIKSSFPGTEIENLDEFDEAFNRSSLFYETGYNNNIEKLNENKKNSVARVVYANDKLYIQGVNTNGKFVYYDLNKLVSTGEKEQLKDSELENSIKLRPEGYVVGYIATAKFGRSLHIITNDAKIISISTGNIVYSNRENSQDKIKAISEIIDANNNDLERAKTESVITSVIPPSRPVTEKGEEEETGAEGTGTEETGKGGGPVIYESGGTTEIVTIVDADIQDIDIQDTDDIEEAPFSTQNEAAIQKDISEAKKLLKEIVPFDVEEMSSALQNMLNDGTAVGAFHKNIIYLLNDSVKYHEAFHGIFRTLMTEKEVSDVMRLAKRKYASPSVSDINKLRNLTNHNKKLSNQQLIDLYYEEKLAEDFQEYMDTGKSVFTKWWRKIIDFIRKFLRKEQDLYTVFRKIEMGNYAKAKQRPTAPYAFYPPAYSSLESVRMNQNGKVYKHFVSKKISLDIAGMVASNMMKISPDISMATEQDFEKAMIMAREEWDPISWFQYFKDNNVKDINAKMISIVDFYNSLMPKNNDLYFYEYNIETGEYGLFLINDKSGKIVNNNKRFIKEQAKKLLQFYSGEVYLDEEEREDNDEINAEPDEMIRKNSNMYGGFKSESKAFRLFIASTTYDKNIFSLQDVETTRTVNMPIEAQRVYNKINRILSGFTSKDFLSIIEFASRDDVELRAFYDRMMKEIEKEISIGNKENYLMPESSADRFHESPTWNLMVKTFYKTNHDYLHSKTDYANGSFNIKNYFPNRYNYTEYVYYNWDSSYKRLELSDNDAKNTMIKISEKMTMVGFYSKNTESTSALLQELVDLFSNVGISVSKSYLRYSLSKNIMQDLDEINILKLDTAIVEELIKGIRKGNLFSSANADKIRRIALASTYFDEKNTSFVLRNAAGEFIYTSLYNSYDTELFNAMKRSFLSDDKFSVELLRKNLEAMHYEKSFIDRYIRMVNFNPMFNNGITRDNFEIIYSYGMDTKDYNDLDQRKKDLYKVRAYMSKPSTLKGNKRLFNPIIIEAKNTNKLFVMNDMGQGLIKEKDGKISEMSYDMLSAMTSFLTIEVDSVKQYKRDILNIIKGGKIDILIKDYHYREISINGELKKVISYEGKYYVLESKWNTKKYKTHDVFKGYTVREIDKPKKFKEPKGANLFQFANIQDEVFSIVNQSSSEENIKRINELLLDWVAEKAQKEIDSRYIAKLFSDVYSQISQQESDKNRNTNAEALDFFAKDLVASMSIQYTLYGGSPTINHKDYIDITKRNAGVNANGPSIGNTRTKVAVIKSSKINITDPIISKNNANTEIDLQDGQNYATPLWYFSKYAKYKSIVGLRKIALKVTAGISLTDDEIKILEKNNMLLIDRKIVIRDTFFYDKTSVHIQARESVSDLIVSNEKALANWIEYLKNPSPELYNKIIYPMYVAKEGFEYHHDMLNSMEAQGIDIMITDSASKNATPNVADDIRGLMPIYIGDQFIREQVKTDRIKKEITDPTQPNGLLFSEQSKEFQVYGDKLLEALSYRVTFANNGKIEEFFPDGNANYELIWDKVKDNIAVTDPQLYELLNVENGVPKYNWNIPTVNGKIIAAMASALSKGGLNQRNKGTKATLVSSYKYGKELNWKVTDDRFPGVFFSEVYVTEYMLKKMGLKVGDIMWGTRIPTEDKYSMANMKIKGVIKGPYAMSIFLPKELMFLSGADFDLDAEYIKTFNEMSKAKREKLFNMLFSKELTVENVIEEFATGDNKEDTKLASDIITFLSMVLTHNVGNENIYSSGNNVDIINNSGINPNEEKIESSVSFFDKSLSERSNTLAKDGVGPAAVNNVAFQKMNKYFPGIFKLIVNGEVRMNKINATHISGMVDNAKNLIMSKYGLEADNINKVVAFVIAYDLNYSQALRAVRDYYTITTINDKAGFLNSKRNALGEEGFQKMIDGYISDGYVITLNEDGYVVNVESEIKEDANSIIETIENLEKFIKITGTIVRLNKKMPSRSNEYHNLEKQLKSFGISMKRRYYKEGSDNHEMLLERMVDNKFLMVENKILVNLGNEIMEMEIGLKRKKNPYARYLLEIIMKDPVVKNELSAYFAYGEFNKKVFIKYKPIFRMLVDKVNDLLYEQYNNFMYNLNNDIEDKDIDNMIKVSDEFILAALNATAYIDTSNRPIYTETVYESLENGTSLLEGLSKRILKEEFVRLLYDIKYKKTEGSAHIATIATLNDESDGLKSEYTNDYMNMYNSSTNYAVFDEFVKAENKQQFIDNLSLNDAKMVMSLLIFNYAMTKDAMMYNATSFSKIIDPRLFVKYGKASSDIFDAFTSFSTYSQHYNTSSVDAHMDILAKKIFDAMLEYMSSARGERIFPVVKNYSKEKMKPAPVKFIYAAPGLGKTFLVNKNKKQYIDIDELVMSKFLSVYAEDIADGTISKDIFTYSNNSLFIGVYDSGMIEEMVKNKFPDFDISKVKDVVSSVRKEFQKGENAGKIVLSAYSDNKIKTLMGNSFSYNFYFIPSFNAVDSIIERIASREDNPFTIEREKYIDYYIKMYSGKRNAFVVDTYETEEGVVASNLEREFKKINNVDTVISKEKDRGAVIDYDGKKYFVVGKEEIHVFDISTYDKLSLDDKDMESIYNLKLVKDNAAVKIEYDSKEYIVHNDNTVFDVEEKTYLEEGENKDTIAKKGRAAINEANLKYKGDVVTVTIRGKEMQYKIINDRIYNSENKEVYSGNRVERRIIMNALMVVKGDAVNVFVDDQEYTVTKSGKIYDYRADEVNFGEDSVVKKEILELANEKFSYQSPEDIYNDVSKYPKYRSNVKSDEEKAKKGSEAKEFISAYKVRGIEDFVSALKVNNAIGNPWDSGGYSLYKTKNTKESVVEFIRWLKGENDIEELIEYRNAILERIESLKNTDIYYYTKPGFEPPVSHAEALDYMINHYPWKKGELPKQVKVEPITDREIVLFDSDTVEEYYNRNKDLFEGDYKGITFDDFQEAVSISSLQEVDKIIKSCK